MNKVVIVSDVQQSESATHTEKCVRVSFVDGATHVLFIWLDIRPKRMASVAPLRDQTHI